MKIKRKRFLMVILFSMLAVCLSSSAFTQSDIFVRNDGYDFTGLHYLKVGGSNPDNFNILITSDSDFRRFKLQLPGRFRPDPYWLVNKIRVDMNNDGTWEQDWTDQQQ